MDSFVGKIIVIQIHFRQIIFLSFLRNKYVYNNKYLLNKSKLINVYLSFTKKNIIWENVLILMNFYFD